MCRVSKTKQKWNDEITELCKIYLPHMIDTYKNREKTMLHDKLFYEMCIKQTYGDYTKILRNQLYIYLNARHKRNLKKHRKHLCKNKYYQQYKIEIPKEITEHCFYSLLRYFELKFDRTLIEYIIYMYLLGTLRHLKDNKTVGFKHYFYINKEYIEEISKDNNGFNIINTHKAEYNLFIPDKLREKLYKSLNIIENNTNNSNHIQKSSSKSIQEFISKKYNIYSRQVDKTIISFIKYVISELNSGRNVYLNGFGSFIITDAGIVFKIDKATDIVFNNGFKWVHTRMDKLSDLNVEDMIEDYIVKERSGW